MTSALVRDRCLAHCVVASRQLADPILAVARHFRHLRHPFTAREQPYVLPVATLDPAVGLSVTLFQFALCQMLAQLDISCHSMIIYPVLVLHLETGRLFRSYRN